MHSSTHSKAQPPPTWRLWVMRSREKTNTRSIPQIIPKPRSHSHASSSSLHNAIFLCVHYQAPKAQPFQHCSLQIHMKRLTITPMEATTTKIHLKTLLWYTMATTHEEAMANGAMVIKGTRSIAILLQFGNILSEVYSCSQASMFFPKIHFPSTYQDGVSGQTSHFIQTPCHQTMDVITNLVHKC